MNKKYTNKVFVVKKYLRKRNPKTSPRLIHFGYSKKRVYLPHFKQQTERFLSRSFGTVAFSG